jgi:hypothetical protein
LLAVRARRADLPPPPGRRAPQRLGAVHARRLRERELVRPRPGVRADPAAGRDVPTSSRSSARRGEPGESAIYPIGRAGHPILLLPPDRLPRALPCQPPLALLGATSHWTSVPRRPRGGAGPPQVLSCAQGGVTALSPREPSRDHRNGTGRGRPEQGHTRWRSAGGRFKVLTPSKAA